MNQGEIVVYQENSNTNFQIPVRIEDETVWLTQLQMADLFETSKQNISLHIVNLYKEEELIQESTVKEYLSVQIEGNREVKRKTIIYSLDVIISVGYRVKSKRGTQFRIWANKILKEYLLKGHAINNRFEKIEKEIHDLKSKTKDLDFQIRTNLPPHEGIFFNGQIFDAYVFVSDIIKNSKTSIILIDNYIDESVLTLLSKRNPKVKAIIYTKQISKLLKLDLQKHNAQYQPIVIKTLADSHDRFLLVDHQELYHIGASLKDLGKKWFAFSKMNSFVENILERIK
ncbi:MAG: RhuM family protein [Bacteroidota bacterium]